MYSKSIGNSSFELCVWKISSWCFFPGWYNFFNMQINSMLNGHLILFNNERNYVHVLASIGSWQAILKNCSKICSHCLFSSWVFRKNATNTVLQAPYSLFTVSLWLKLCFVITVFVSIDAIEENTRQKDFMISILKIVSGKLITSCTEEGGNFA